MEPEMEVEVEKPKSTGCGCFGLIFFLGMIFLFAFVFGYFIKTTDEYACVLQITQQDDELVRSLGEPIEPGFFAWLSNYGGEGQQFETSFRTAVSGPRDSGNIHAQIYLSPVGSAMTIKFSGDAGNILIYDGPYQCP
jgi:hypothetical protein